MPCLDIVAQTIKITAAPEGPRGFRVARSVNVTSMKAIIITGTGGPEVLELGERPLPEPGGSQIRVRVRACGLNRADLLQCRGFYPAPPGAPAGPAKKPAGL